MLAACTTFQVLHYELSHCEIELYFLVEFIISILVPPTLLMRLNKV